MGQRELGDAVCKRSASLPTIGSAQSRATCLARWLRIRRAPNFSRRT